MSGHTFDCDPSTVVAVIGCAGRFPGAQGVAEFWQNVLAGTETLTEFGEDELRAAGVAPAMLADARYVKVRGVLNEVERFEADFFGYSAQEAAAMDPQHRLFLQTAWLALEDAGYDPARIAGKVGVYAGAAINSYLLNNLAPHRLSTDFDPLQAMIGNDKDFVATRVSYKLNLKGPSVNVQTACSTSLVAVHLACQSVLSGECELALAGGVSIQFPYRDGYLCVAGGVLSADGHCRPFDVAAAGTVSGDGVAVVVLKRLDAAQRDGDNVLAVIRGSAINNDGASKVAFTAPSVEGQADVIREAHAMAGVNPDSIGYVEAHGTGTALGDPIEVAALIRAFASSGDSRGFCALGSVKANIGHLNTAAGVVALIKAVLAVKEGVIPPMRRFTAANPALQLEQSPFFVNAELLAWKSDGAPRRAGVSSFGLGGTNAHVVLEEAPRSLDRAANGRSADAAPEASLLVLSARSNAGLNELSGRLADHLERHPDICLRDAAFTLQTGRRAFPFREAYLGCDSAELIRALRARKSGVRQELTDGEPRRVVFCFAGETQLDLEWGQRLYREHALFRARVDQAGEVLQRLAPERASVADAGSVVRCWALAELWRSWGVQPSAVLGKGVGRYAAAISAGVLSLEDGLALALLHEQATNCGKAQQAFARRLASARVAEPTLTCGLSSRSGWCWPTQSQARQPESWLTPGAESGFSEALGELSAGRPLLALHLDRPMSSSVEPAHAPILFVRSARTSPEMLELIRLAERGVTVTGANGDLFPDSDDRAADLPERLAIVAASESELRARLTALTSGAPAPAVWRRSLAAGHRPRVAFLFSGHGSSYWGMGAGLYAEEPVFRAIIKRCSEHASPLLGRPLAALFDQGASSESAALEDWAYAQAAIYVLQAGLVHLWRSWGVEPALVMGHSLGEYAAAYAAGIFTLEAGLDLVLERARLMRELADEGAMAALFAPASVIRAAIEKLSSPVGIAALNGPQNTVISGRREAVCRLIGELKSQGLEAEMLEISHASHSPCMDPLLDPFERFVESFELRAPSVPLVSNVTGVVAGAEVTDARYWRRHLRDTVQFQSGCETIAALHADVVLELGPSGALLGLVKACWSGPQTMWLSSLKRYRHHRQHLPEVIALLHAAGVSLDWKTLSSSLRRWQIEELSSLPVAGAAHPLLAALAALWKRGVPVSWETLHTGRSRRKVSLPGYAFGGESYFIRPPQPAQKLDMAREDALERLPREQWLYVPGWKRATLPATPLAAKPHAHWLIFSAGSELDSELERKLLRYSGRVTWVGIGQGFQRIAADRYVVSPRVAADYEQLLASLADGGEGGGLPRCVLHAWSLHGSDGASTSEQEADAHDLSFHSLLFLVQALDRAGGQPVEINVATRGLHDVVGSESLVLQGAALDGLCRVIPQEYAQIRGRSIDLDPRSNEAADADQLWQELSLPIPAWPITTGNAACVAYRGGHRWLQTIEPLRASSSGAAPPASWLDGGYLIVGGSGGIGSVLARHWARARRGIRLALLSRTALPPRDQWQDWLTTRPAKDRTSCLLRLVADLESDGAEVMTIAADVADRAAMRAALRAIGERFGALRGVVHAAGIGGGGIMQLKTRAMVRQVFAPKIDGTVVLGELLAEHASTLQFVVLCSALNSFTGALGHADYCAANAFQSAYARKARAAGLPWVAVAWDAWSEVGMGVDIAAPLGAEALWRENFALGIRSEEGAQLLHVILGCGLAEVAVSTCDLAARLRVMERWTGQGRDGEASIGATNDVPSGSPRHPRPPSLRTPYTSPRDDLERRVAELWQEHLGFERVGVFDTFFELGGHSLLAIRLAASLRREFQIEIRLSSLFEAPTVAQLAAVVKAEIAKPGAQKLLAAESTPVFPTATAGSDHESFPLAYSQERMWFFRQIEPDSPAYNMSVPLRLRGALRIADLRAAFERVVARHAMLRAELVLGGDLPSQRIAASRKIDIELIDLRDEPESRRESVAQRRTEQEARRPFTMFGESLLRASLLILSPTDHILLITVHHIIGDGWSIGILLNELWTLYEAADGRDLPPIRASFAEFASAQRKAVEQGSLAAQLSYWRVQLGNPPPALLLPTDREATGPSSFAGGAEWLELPGELSRRIELFGEREGVTPYMTLLAAFNALLYRYSSQAEVLVGTPVANRRQPEYETVVGPFANTVVIRTAIDDELSFRELLLRVRETALEAFANQELPFEVLLAELAGGQRAATTLFRVLFIFSAPLPSLATSGLTIDPVHAEPQTALSDLVLYVWPSPDGLSLKLEYSKALFEAATARRTLEHLRNLLEHALSAPEDPIWRLPLLTSHERGRLVEIAKGRELPIERTQDVH